MASNSLRNLNLSSEDIRSLDKALREPEFRSLLLDYVKEVNDPANKALYESEVIAMERERGFDVVFLHPTPGFVLKVFDVEEKKIFVNVCSDPNVARPECRARAASNGGNWAIPYSTSQPRRDVDKKGEACSVYDVIFHPDTLRMAERNGRFKNLVKETALEAVEKLASGDDVVLDRTSVRQPKMTYKGAFHPTVIRKPIKEQVKERKPNYVIKYRDVDGLMDRALVNNVNRDPTRPSEIVIEIELPEFNGAAGVELDVTETKLTLSTESPAKYALELKLPYPVDEENGSAKFDKCTKKLIVTLPVVLIKEKAHVDRLISTDSGIEADEEVATLEDLEEEEEGEEVKEEEEEEAEEEEAECLMMKPSYSVSVFDDNMIFTLDVKNVDPSSVTRTSSSDSKRPGFSIKFSSLGAGMVSFDYGFAFRFVSSEEINSFPEDLEVEVWDNNVTFQVPLSKSFQDFMVGLTEKDLSIVTKPNLAALREKQEKLKKSTEKELENFMKQRKTQLICDSKNPEEFSDSKMVEQEQEEEDDENGGNEDKERHSSGESEDSAISESPHNRFRVTSLTEKKDTTEIFVNNQGRVGLKGILKRRQRCLSESQADQYKRWAAAAATYGAGGDSSVSSSIAAIDEEDESSSSLAASAAAAEEDGQSSCSSKKSVRFSEVVQRQMFRQNASILGQKQKNLKKAEQKKKRLEQRERRASEGDVDSITRESNHEDSGVASSVDSSSTAASTPSTPPNNPPPPPPSLNRNSSKKSRNSKKKKMNNSNDPKFLNDVASDLMFELDIE